MSTSITARARPPDQETVPARAEQTTVTAQALLTGAAGIHDARETVRTHLRLWGVATETLDDAVLIASELATNVVEHGGGHGLLTVERQAEGVLIRTEDQSAALPCTPDYDPGDPAEAGCGLLLVATLATRHGYRREHCGGKTVWAYLSLSADNSPTTS